MSQGLILSILQQMIYEILFISLPLLGVAMAIGLLVSIFQATTSIQEQTLTFVPKMVIIFLTLAFLAPLYITHLTDFTVRMFDLIATASL